MTGRLEPGIDVLLERALHPPTSVRELTLLVRDLAAQLRGAVAAFNFVEGERVKALADADAARVLAERAASPSLEVVAEVADRKLLAELERLRAELDTAKHLLKRATACSACSAIARIASVAAERELHEPGCVRAELERVRAELEVATAANAVATEVAEDCVAITAAVVRDPGMFDVEADSGSSEDDDDHGWLDPELKLRLEVEELQAERDELKSERDQARLDADNYRRERNELEEQLARARHKLERAELVDGGAS